MSSSADRQRLDDPGNVDEIVANATRTVLDGRSRVRPARPRRGPAKQEPPRKPRLALPTEPAAPAVERPPSMADLLEKDRDETESADDEQPANARKVLEWIGVVFGAVVVAILIKTFLVQAFFIPSESMESTLEPGDRVLVNKLSYDLHDIHRGDVVVFSLPQAMAPGEPKGDLIKRVIGLPGDTVEVRSTGVYVNGAKLDEPYVNLRLGEGPIYPRTRVPDKTVFVMGDNRTNSRDSRYFGPVPTSDIVGRAFFRLWPLTSIGSL